LAAKHAEASRAGTGHARKCAAIRRAKHIQHLTDHRGNGNGRGFQIISLRSQPVAQG